MSSNAINSLSWFKVKIFTELISCAFKVFVFFHATGAACADCQSVASVHLCSSELRTYWQFDSVITQVCGGMAALWMLAGM